jgi:hypothetical protein
MQPCSQERTNEFIKMLGVSPDQAAELVDKKIDDLLLIWELLDEKIIDADGLCKAAQILLSEVELKQ